ncbi:MAG: hypothetical protein LBQ60_18415 [Bacteroidales bacterium]|jgi:hypothetical protein|nr:hypothetical protein [Bacteroidales bacterium]
MKKLFVGFLFIVSLQIVSGRDSINSNSSPKTARSLFVGVQLGGSILLNSSANYELGMLYYASPQESPNYKKRPTNGWAFKGDIYNLFSRHFGLGINYSFFMFSSSNDFTLRSGDDFEYLYMDMRQKQYIHYIAPSAIFRQWLDKNQKLQLTETISAGYVHYRDELSNDAYTNGYYPFTRVLFKNHTWGINACMSFNYHIMPRLSVGANVGFMYANMNKLEITSHNTGKKTRIVKFDKNQPLTMLDYSFNIRFYIFE